MSFCSNCGAELTEGTAFCPNCGAGQVSTFGADEPVAVAAEPEVLPAEPVYQEPIYQEPVDQEPVYQEPVYQEPVYQLQVEAAVLPTSAKILGLICMICGLVSLVSCYVGFAYSIPALILSSIASKKAPGIPNGKAKVGKITAIIGIVVSVICFIVYVALVATGTEYFMEMEPFYDF
jgi:hypothetical protein